MHYIWLKCRCGYEADRPARPGEWEAMRDEILRRSKCSRCGKTGAADLRKYWNIGASALEGARSGNKARPSTAWKMHARLVEW